MMTYQVIPTPMFRLVVIVSPQPSPMPQPYLRRVIRPTEMPVKLLLMPPGLKAPVRVLQQPVTRGRENAARMTTMKKGDPKMGMKKEKREKKQK